MARETSPTAMTCEPNHQVEIEMGVAAEESPAPEVGSNDLTAKNDQQRLRVEAKSDQIIPEDPENPLDTSIVRSKKAVRLGVVIFGFMLLILGRLGVPEVEVPCVKDRLLDALSFANVFINTPGNEYYRAGFQLICSLLVDATCLMTFIYWINKGTSYRLPLSLILFYGVRAIVQAIWISPFTEGYYWESPGIPSLVVPYGRGSDFFFSGHTGFMVICFLEWHYLKINKVRNFVGFAAIYTMLILMVYRIHYSIDVFTGAFFAEWCFIKVDKHKEVIADKIGKVSNKLLWVLGGRYRNVYKGT